MEIGKVINKILFYFLLIIHKHQFKHYGIKSKIDFITSYIVNKKLISIGDYVFIGPHVYISANLEIENYVMMGPKVTIIGGNHLFGQIGKRNRFLSATPESRGKIVIKEDAWIGCNVTILPDVVIGSGAIIAAGSIVNKNIPPYCLAAGNPAKVKKLIFSNEELNEHLVKLKCSENEAEEIVKERKLYCEKNNISC